MVNRRRMAAKFGPAWRNRNLKLVTLRFSKREAAAIRSAAAVRGLTVDELIALALEGLMA